MQLSIVTINYKKPELTLSCLSSLYAAYSQQFEKNLFELIVVDNLSKDDSVDILENEVKKKKYKNVHILAHKENNGFGGGNNFGAAHAKGEMLLFLNNDTQVDGGIEEMLLFAKDKNAGIVGGVLQNTNGTSQHSYDSFYSLSRVLLLLLGVQRLRQQKMTVPMQVDWVKGACLMISKSLFEKLHGFDEHIFMYTEDMEMCYRARKLGEQVWVYPGVAIRHADQGSSSRTFAVVSIYKGILYFYKKHKSMTEYVLVKLLLQTKAHILILLGKLTKSTYLVTTYEEALTVCR